MGKKHKKHHKSDKNEKKHHEDKPLKLVLKVGTPESQDPYTFSQVEEKVHLEKHKKAKKKKKKKSSEREKEDKKQKHHHRHHHHEKKKSKKRDRDTYESDRDVLEEFSEPALKKVALEPRTRPPRACTLKGPDDDHNPLQQLMLHLLKLIQRKDPQQFFAWPVNDIIAPGYSTIISHPMDISTMREKIDNNEYTCVNEFRSDLKLMCDNATTYNHPDTIYYKAAKRLLHIGMKLMSKEKLSAMKRNLVFMNKLGKDELGFEDDREIEPLDTDIQALEEETVIVKEIKKKNKAKTSLEREDVLTDNLSPSEILAQVQQAAKEVAERLRQVKPKSKIGFLRRQKDGSTTLAILNGNAEYGPKERPVNLEMLTGKVTQGTGSLGGFKEDKRNKANPLTYLNYGSFSSYAPTYDSTFSNLTKEESDLLYYTYGDETGVQYAQSIMRYVQDTGNTVTSMVDTLLDLLTGGEHSKTVKIINDRKIEEKKAQDEAKKEAEKQFQAQKLQNGYLSEENLDSLRSLSELGIDMSFLDSMDLQSNSIDPVSNKMFEIPIQSKLDQTASLLQELDKTQNERLSQKLPSHLAHVPGPSDGEVALAGRVTDSLKALASQVTPGDLVTVGAIRTAMGVTTHPIEILDDSPQIKMDEKVNSQDQQLDVDRELREFLEQAPKIRICNSLSLTNS